MGWAKHYFEKLRKGETVSFRPRGNSMVGRIKSGQLCTVIPVTAECLPRVDDVVLCRVAGNDYLHLVKAIANNRYQIANNRGRVNGWIGIESVYGVCVKVEN